MDRGQDAHIGAAVVLVAAISEQAVSRCGCSPDTPSPPRPGLCIVELLEGSLLARLTKRAGRLRRVVAATLHPPKSQSHSLANLRRIVVGGEVLDNIIPHEPFTSRSEEGHSCSECVSGKSHDGFRAG